MKINFQDGDTTDMVPEKDIKRRCFGQNSRVLFLMCVGRGMYCVLHHFSNQVN